MDCCAQNNKAQDESEDSLCTQCLTELVSRTWTQGECLAAVDASIGESSSNASDYLCTHFSDRAANGVIRLSVFDLGNEDGKAHCGVELST